MRKISSALVIRKLQSANSPMLTKIAKSKSTVGRKKSLGAITSNFKSTMVMERKKMTEAENAIARWSMEIRGRLDGLYGKRMAVSKRQTAPSIIASSVFACKYGAVWPMQYLVNVW